MDFTEVKDQLNDLPRGFKRTNAPYLQLIDALTSALVRYTNAADATSRNLTFANAVGGWLDVWGLLLGIARYAMEADSHYSARISLTLTGGAGPVQAMINWIQQAWGLTVTITENFPNVGYNIFFPATATPAQINLILKGLAQIRPAGVPFTGQVADIGTYLDTVNFYDAANVTGQYFGGGFTAVTITFGAGTNNQPPLLPQLVLEDPTLNPGR